MLSFVNSSIEINFKAKVINVVNEETAGALPSRRVRVALIHQCRADEHALHRPDASFPGLSCILEAVFGKELFKNHSHFQLVNTAFFMLNAIYAFIPNFAIVCGIILYEGLIGGASYVNTFHHIHKKVPALVLSITLQSLSEEQKRKRKAQKK